jgi:hypothetical protein
MTVAGETQRRIYDPTASHVMAPLPEAPEELERAQRTVTEAALRKQRKELKALIGDH